MYSFYKWKKWLAANHSKKKKKNSEMNSPACETTLKSVKVLK